jgi:uncharacterized protein (TIGR02145 family)
MIKHNSIFPAFLLLLLNLALSSCSQEKLVWDLAKVPVVRTGSPTEIKHNSFRLSAQVEGGEKLKEKGFCIAQTANPTIKENRFLVDSGRASYSGLLKNLWADTLYYIRAYASNATGTGYGNAVEVKTLPGFCPVLQTIPTVLSNGDKDLESGGIMLDDGGYPILAKGICWSDQPGPIAGPGTSTNEGAGRENFTSRINGLQPGKNYFIRAYATNVKGTCYGEEKRTRLEIPALQTKAVSDISFNQATSGGNISSDGGSPISARGVCWSTSPNPTVSLSTKTLDSMGAGNFNSLISGLNPGITYYVRAYAVNAIGIAYGNEVNFKTSITLASIETVPVSAITTTSATCGGVISSDGGSPVTARGVCWSLSQNPTTTLNAKTSNGTGNGIFTSSLTNLQANKTYYVRAYATNAAGTAYGDQLTFTTTPITLATILTSAISGASFTTAISGGNITSTGGGSITARGICWRTSPNPTIALTTKTNNGPGSGIFSSNMTNLNPGTTYYVRAYATNAAGTAYGNQVTFATSSIQLPTLSTYTVTSITGTSATCGANSITDGGGTITAKGVCWSINSNPTIALSTKTNNGTGTASFTSNITGLLNGTTYYVRAYATNSAGTAYGVQRSFTTWSLPIIVTTNPTTISWSTASSGGSVTSDGGSLVTVRGVCWSTSSNPTVLLSTKTINGSGTGTFSSNITGLNASTTYFVRAYATSAVGTAYGNEISFVTSAAILPSISTSTVTGITGAGANCGGSISSDGGALVTSRGVCWNTSPNPTIALATKTSDGTGLGSFSSIISSLTPGTTYYVKAYASNSVGTAYGNQLVFTTCLSCDIDGNNYQTITIGSQKWMKENLKVSKYRNGESITTGLAGTAWSSSTSGAYAIYNDVSSNNTTYGKLYNWYAVADPRGLCPAGWHVPTDHDWNILTKYLDPAADTVVTSTSSSIAGGYMKAVSSLWTNPNTGATNSSGFMGLPGGYRTSSGNLYSSLGTRAYWWSSSTGTVSTTGWYRLIYNSNANVTRGYASKAGGYSVRCLKD